TCHAGTPVAVMLMHAPPVSFFGLTSAMADAGSVRLSHIPPVPFDRIDHLIDVAAERHLRHGHREPRCLPEVSLGIGRDVIVVEQRVVDIAQEYDRTAGVIGSRPARPPACDTRCQSPRERGAVPWRRLGRPPGSGSRTAPHFVFHRELSFQALTIAENTG